MHLADRSRKSWAVDRYSATTWFGLAVLLVVVGVVFGLIIYGGTTGWITLVIALVAAVACVVQGIRRRTI